LPKRDGFTVYIPASRQEKGVDLAIIKKQGGGESRVATIQVKASRTYIHGPPKRATTTPRFRYYMWFNRFDVQDEADFFLLVGMYAPNMGRTTQVGPEWYRDCTLMFSREEMKDFMAKCLAVSGKPDRMFAFGFDNERSIVQTRGNKAWPDFTAFRLDNRISLLRQQLSAQPK